MNPGNQIWILLAFVALSFLQWLIRRLQEQSAINKKKQAEARRREEILRTGRDPDQQPARQPDTASVSAEAAARQARLRELRQKQLEEMRRKGQPKPAPSAQVRVPPRPAPPQAPGRTGPVVIGPGSRPPPTRPQTQTIGGPQPTRSKPAPPAPPQRRPAAAPTAAPQRSRNLPAAPARPSGAEAPAPPKRTRPAAPGTLRDTTTPQSLASTPLISEIPEAAAPGVASATRAIGSGMTAADWRRALILGEVLAPPVSLRNDR